MAPDPSPISSERRGHVRKSTVVIPALPLALEKKGLGHRSQASASAKGARSLPESVASKVQPPPQIAPIDPESTTERSAKDVLDSLQVEHDSQGLQDALNLPAAVPVTTTIPIEEAVIGDEQRPLSHVNESLQDSTTDADAPQAIGTAINIENIAVQQDAELETAVAPSAPTENADGRKDVISDKKVQLPEEDSPPSEHEASSIQPSSTTGLTDYGSPAAESTLETVIVSPEHARNTHSHRKSEAAPETLTNGFTSTPSRSGSATHRANGSQVISQPRQTPIPSMQDHLLYLASTKQYFDTIIYVNHPETSYQPSEHFGHTLLLTRSPDFAKLILEPEQPGQPHIINLYPARNILPHAFEAALRFFYSDHVLTFQTLVPQGAYQDRQTKEQTFEYTMSYWFAGVELGLLPVKNRSHEMVRQLIDWELADSVAKEIQNLRIAEENFKSAYIQNEIRAIANSLTSLLTQLYVSRLDLTIFNLDGNAQGLHTRGRFSQLEFPRANNPALSGMVFGSLQTELPQPQNTQATASAILMNLDFGDFEAITKEIAARHGQIGENLIHEAVQQREAKRQEVVTNRAVSNKQRLNHAQLWEVTGWKEHFDENGRLTREKVDFTLPTKSR